MAYETVKDWMAASEMEPWMDTIKNERIPPTVDECLRDEGWASIYHFYAKANYVTESLDFIAKVDDFGRNGDMRLAKQIYDEHVARSAPMEVNLPADTAKQLHEYFEGQDEPIAPPDVFDRSRREIVGMLQNDSYGRFRLIARDVQVALWDDETGGGRGRR